MKPSFDLGEVSEGLGSVLGSTGLAQHMGIFKGLGFSVFKVPSRDAVGLTMKQKPNDRSDCQLLDRSETP